MTEQERKQWYGDCPTCIYTSSAKGNKWKSGTRICTHPAGEQYTIEGLVSNCDGWIENKGA